MIVLSLIHTLYSSLQHELSLLSLLEPPLVIAWQRISAMSSASVLMLLPAGYSPHPCSCKMHSLTNFAVHYNTDYSPKTSLVLPDSSSQCQLFLCSWAELTNCHLSTNCRLTHSNSTPAHSDNSTVTLH
jgi:hypothetical protein